MLNRIAQSLLFVFALLALSTFSTLAFAEKIAQINVTGLTSISKNTVLNLLPIKPGDEFSLGQLDISISYLRKWGVFDTISADPEITPDGVVINLRLEQAVVVESITITGTYPYIEDKVKKYLDLQVGDIYTPDRLAEQIRRIKDFYKREGFVGTNVYVDEISRPEVEGVALKFHVRRGGVIRYSGIQVDGNKAYPLGRFVSAINPLRPYSEQRFRRSIDRLREFYHEHGYPRARIRIRAKEFDFDKNRVDVALDVYEGPYVEVVFKGAPHTNRKLFRKTITIFKNGSADDFEIEASAAALEELLQDRGYPDAEVGWRREKISEDHILITFNIDEGRSRRIKYLRFAGIDGVSRDELTKAMSNRGMRIGEKGAYLESEVEGDDEAISLILRRYGYLDAKVGKWEVRPTEQGYALDITVPIEAGKQSMVSSIQFRGNRELDTKRILKKFANRVRRPFNEPAVDEDRDRLVQFYSDEGHPYATVESDWKAMPDGSVQIEYTIDEGEAVTIGEILIIGDVLTSQKAIKKAMAIGSGDKFSYRRIIESQLNLRRLGSFSSVNIETIGLEEKQSVVHLKVRVEELRPFRTDFEVSYSAYDGLTGSMLFSNINAFGWAKTNTLKLTAGRKRSRAELGWKDPRFLSSSFEMSDFAWVQYKERPAYTAVQVAGSIGWFRRFRQFNFFARYELDRNYFVEGDSVAADADSLRNNTTSQISLSSSFDSRNNFAYPTKGFFTLLGVDIFNEIAGNNANFFRFKWRGENDHTILKLFTFSTGLRFDRLVTIGKGVSIPENEMLFLGGDDTIRGYGEDSLGPTNAQGRAVGGRLRWIVNEELRIKLWRELSWAFFYDMGALTNSYAAINWDTIKYSAGFGVRYNTPVGPIRLDYGFKLNRKPGESMGRLHFTFGYLF